MGTDKKFLPVPLISCFVFMNIFFNEMFLPKIDNIILDPDPNWVKTWIRIQIKFTWIHNTGGNPHICVANTLLIPRRARDA